MFPLCCVTMDLAARMESMGIRLDLEWVPRTYNVEADSLSNMDTGGFDLQKRRLVDWKGEEWSRLRRLFSEGASFFRDRKILAEARPKVQTILRKRKLRDQGLRVREPW